MFRRNNVNNVHYSSVPEWKGIQYNREQDMMLVEDKRKKER